MLINALVTLPVQIVCHLVGSGNSTEGNVTYALETQSPIENPVLPEGYTAFPDIGVAYKVFNYTSTWNFARKKCIEEGGNLPILDTYKKVGYIAALKGKVTYVYAGIHRLYDNSEWTSVKTGLPLAVHSWSPHPYAETSAAPCTIMHEDGSGIYPYVCHNSYSFACEIPWPSR